MRESAFRRRVYLMLEGGQAAGPAGAAVEYTLVFLIALNVIAYTLLSVPAIRHSWRRELNSIELVSVAIFTVEYVVRLWTAVEDPVVAALGPVRGRIKAASSAMMAIDFFAIAPAYVALVVPFIDLRILRLVRLLRLLKIARYSPALSTLAQVVSDERRALIGTLLLLLCVMMFAAATMHTVEGSIQPAAFGTIPDSMWWSISTLTTVGGNVAPITPMGKLVAAVTMILGVGLLALPVGIVATGFVETIHRRDFVVTFGMLARVPLFKGFSAETVAELMMLLRAQSVRPGQIISAEGERAAAMYFVVAGEVEARLPGRTLRFGAGDFCGELALLHDTMIAATIIAVTPSRLLALSAEDFERLLQRKPTLKLQFQKLAAAHAHDVAQAGGISEAEIETARAMREEPRREG